jgi:hypothetical protein
MEGLPNHIDEVLTSAGRRLPALRKAQSQPNPFCLSPDRVGRKHYRHPVTYSGKLYQRVPEPRITGQEKEFRRILASTHGPESDREEPPWWRARAGSDKPAAPLLHARSSTTEGIRMAPGADTQSVRHLIQRELPAGHGRRGGARNVLTLG